MKNRMKNSITSLIVIVTLTLCSCSSSSSSEKYNTSTQKFNMDTTTLKKGAVFYQCEMDPQVITDKARNCPACGMELSEIVKQ